jgi:hypothetical protein
MALRLSILDSLIVGKLTSLTTSRVGGFAGRMRELKKRRKRDGIDFSSENVVRSRTQPWFNDLKKRTRVVSGTTHPSRPTKLPSPDLKTIHPGNGRIHSYSMLF